MKTNKGNDSHTFEKGMKLTFVRQLWWTEIASWQGPAYKQEININTYSTDSSIKKFLHIHCYSSLTKNQRESQQNRHMAHSGWCHGKRNLVGTCLLPSAHLSHTGTSETNDKGIVQYLLTHVVPNLYALLLFCQ